MKKIILVLFVALFSIAVVDAQQPKGKQTVTTTFNTDIDCEGCAKKVTNTIPYEKGVKDVKVDDGLKGWENFTKLTTISRDAYNQAKTDLTGERNSVQVFIEDLWTGKKSVDQVITELNAKYNKAVKTFYDANPDMDFNSVLKSEWDISLKIDEVE